MLLFILYLFHVNELFTVSFFPHITAKATTGLVETRLLANCGDRKEIISDNVSVFKSQVFRDMCLRWGISHFTTRPYRSCPNRVE
jgi:hypothetical protein